MIPAGSSASAPCFDELEIYGPGSPENLALARRGAKASASSCIGGFPIHAVPHLNDGEYGNDRSWIAAGTGDEWAQIELPAPAAVSKVVFSRDRLRRYGDRAPSSVEIHLSMDGKTWLEAGKIAGRPKTRRWVLEQGRPSEPLGWVAIE